MNNTGKFYFQDNWDSDIYMVGYNGGESELRLLLAIGLNDHWQSIEFYTDDNDEVQHYTDIHEYIDDIITELKSGIIINTELFREMTIISYH